MTSLDITHWDIAAFIVLLGVGFICGFIAGRFYNLIDKMYNIINRRVERKRRYAKK